LELNGVKIGVGSESVTGTDGAKKREVYTFGKHIPISIIVARAYPVDSLRYFLIFGKKLVFNIRPLLGSKYRSMLKSMGRRR